MSTGQVDRCGIEWTSIEWTSPTGLAASCDPSPGPRRRYCDWRDPQREAQAIGEFHPGELDRIVAYIREDAALAVDKVRAMAIRSLANRIAGRDHLRVDGVMQSTGELPRCPDAEEDVSDWSVPPETDDMLRERIAVLEERLRLAVEALREIHRKCVDPAHLIAWNALAAIERVKP